MSETDLMILEILLRKANVFVSDQDLRELKLAQIIQDLVNNCLNSKSTEFMLGVILGMNIIITRLHHLTQYYDDTKDVKKETSKLVSSLSNMLALFPYACRVVICSRKRERRNWFNEAIRSIALDLQLIGWEIIRCPFCLRETEETLRDVKLMLGLVLSFSFSGSTGMVEYLNKLYLVKLVKIRNV